MLSALPSYRRSQAIEGIDADNLADARDIVARLQSFADACAERATNPPTRPSSGPTGTHSGGNPNGPGGGHPTRTAGTKTSGGQSAATQPHSTGRRQLPGECAGS